MLKTTNSSEEDNYRENDEVCYCHANHETHQIIENYRSILDRKQQLILSWIVVEKNGKFGFTHGSRFSNSTDALVIRSGYTCLINPWYRYATVNKHLLAHLRQNQSYQICEVILLECQCSTSSHQYELAIIECPCLQQLKTYCTYCRLILTATEQSNTLLPTQLLNDINQQANTSSRLDCDFDKEININDSFYQRSGSDDYSSTTPNQFAAKVNSPANNKYDIKFLTNVPRTSLGKYGDSSLSEDKSIVLLQEDDTKQSLPQPDTDGQSSNSSISLHFLSQKRYLLRNDSTRPRSRTAQHAVDSDDDRSSETTTKYKFQGTQTKLFAILLPQSPLSEMKQAEIEERTAVNVTRTCQVNTLGYLIKSNESQTAIPYPTATGRKHGFNVFSVEFQAEKLKDGFETIRIDLTPTNEEISSNEDQMEMLNLMASSLKCINAFDAIDLNQPSASVNSSRFDHNTNAFDEQDQESYSTTSTINIERVDTDLKLHTKSFNNSDNHIIKYSDDSSIQAVSNPRNHLLSSMSHLTSNGCLISKLYHSKTNPYRSMLRKRRRHRIKRRASGFLQRLRRREKPFIVQQSFSKQHNSSFFIVKEEHSSQSEHHTCSPPLHPIQHNAPPLCRVQQSSAHLPLNTANSMCHYTTHDHTIVARASINSTACIQLQVLLNNHDNSLAQLIDLQLRLTSDDNYRSVCVLIDDHKESEQHRSSFLHYIYKTLSDTLKKILETNSKQMTCMNLVFFNNSLCDIVNMQRLRLIDTGKKVLLSPSCEVSLKTATDIDIAINRLNTKMSFAHQMFIINFHREQSLLTGSFLFLHLAPICSVRPIGLLTNLNSTTYSVLNLIRQLSNNQLIKHNTSKRYLFNDYSLNRLLKNYLFSVRQTITVLTMKPKENKQ